MCTYRHKNDTRDTPYRYLLGISDSSHHDSFVGHFLKSLVILRMPYNN